MWSALSYLWTPKGYSCVTAGTPYGHCTWGHSGPRCLHEPLLFAFMVEVPAAPGPDLKETAPFSAGATAIGDRNGHYTPNRGFTLVGHQYPISDQLARGCLQSPPGSPFCFWSHVPTVPLCSLDRNSTSNIYKCTLTRGQKEVERSYALHMVMIWKSMKYTSVGG
jgi:hypothetical protein